MLSALLIGSLTTFVNLAIQVIAILMIIRHLIARLDNGKAQTGFSEGLKVLGAVLGGLFVGHLLQFASWAFLFMWLGEFDDFNTAFYHSAVNFASLGYGDIVMSERWRLLGALEATNGVLMLGLTAGAVLSVMRKTVAQHHSVREITEKFSSRPE